MQVIFIFAVAAGALFLGGAVGYALGKRRQAEDYRKFGGPRRNAPSDAGAQEIVGNLGYHMAQDPYWKA